MDYEPFGFWRYGKELLETYKIVKTNKPAWHSLFSMKYYLLCRAVELYLKAFLLKSGLKISLIRNKNFGHNLENILIKAKEMGVYETCSITKKDAEVIKMVNVYYSKKEFEYIVEGTKHLPSLEDLEIVAEKLDGCIEDYVIDGKTQKNDE